MSTLRKEEAEIEVRESVPAEAVRMEKTIRYLDDAGVRKAGTKLAKKYAAVFKKLAE